jgi:hypothetical protein
MKRIFALTLGMLGLAFALAIPAHSQTTSTTTTTTSTLYVDTHADAVYDAGAWTAATHVTEGFPFIYFNTAKTSYLALEGHELIASAAGFNFYGAGAAYTPDLTSVFKNTTISADNFSLSASASIGNKIPTSGSSHVSGLFFVTAKYRASSTVSFTALQYGALVSAGSVTHILDAGVTKYF